jgi:hypothetical protein
MEQQIFPVPDKILQDFRLKVSLYLTESSWRPKAHAMGTLTTGEMLNSNDPIGAVLSHRLEGGSKQTANIVEAMKRFSVDSVIQTEISSKIMNVFIDGLALAWAVSIEYAKSTGLENLRNKNRQDEELSTEQKIQWDLTNQTDAAVALFTFAHYVVSQLSSFRKEEVDACQIRKMPLPELPLLNKEGTIQCILFYYYSFIDTKELVPNEISMLKLTREYFETVLDDLDKYKASVKYLELFSKVSYESQTLKFTFSGFNRSTEKKTADIFIKELRFDEIVGNQEIKLESERMVERLFTYDIKTKRNPLIDLGGIPRVSMGMGQPGTGKTMILRAMLTLAKELSKETGIPVRSSLLSPTIVSKFQGETASQMLNWCNEQLDPNVITIAGIDDAESVFARRDGKNSSEGSDSVIKTFLTFTEGAASNWMGNSIMLFLTNNWELLDTAVLSRIMKRTFIKGPQTLNDFMDMNHLYLKGLEKHSPGFVKYKQPRNYAYMKDQQMAVSYASMVKEEDIVPKNEKLKDAFHRVGKTYDYEKDPEFIPALTLEIVKEFPDVPFAARDIRNVHISVDDKLMDFSFPKEWWKDMNLFFAKDYDGKMKMLLEQRSENMQGLSLERIFLQEFVKYADIAVEIGNTVFEKSVQANMDEYLIRQEAMRRLDLKLPKKA